MSYYFVAAISVALGFFACALLSQAGHDDRRCINCRHHHQIPDDVPDWLGRDHVVCAACRGVDYDLPGMILPVSLVKPEAYCNEYQPEDTEDG